jgi:hypothetical protein
VFAAGYTFYVQSRVPQAREEEHKCPTTICGSVFPTRRFEY